MSDIAGLEASGQAAVISANAVVWGTFPQRRRVPVGRSCARYLGATDRSDRVPPGLLPAR